MFVTGFVPDTLSMSVEILYYCVIIIAFSFNWNAILRCGRKTAVRPPEFSFRLENARKILLLQTQTGDRVHNVIYSPRPICRSKRFSGITLGKMFEKSRQSVRWQTIMQHPKTADCGQKSTMNVRYINCYKSTWIHFILFVDSKAYKDNKI